MRCLWQRGYSDEIEVLDVLGGGAMRFFALEKCAFDGDRSLALRSLRLMHEDGVVSITRQGAPVEAWRLASWRREPYTEQTKAELADVIVSLA
jgi:hypothetical protein